MSEYVSPLTKARAFLPQIVGFMLSVALVDAAVVLGTGVCAVTFGICGGTVGMLVLFTAVDKASTAGVYGWERLMPPARPKACKRCATLEKDNEELRHALAVLGPISEDGRTS